MPAWLPAALTVHRPAHYEYYLLGQTTPLRVSFDRAGLVMGAEIPAAAGGFRHDSTYLSRLRESSEVEVIDSREFERRAAAYRLQLARHEADAAVSQQD